MRTRNHDWYDPVKHCPMYGVQIYDQGQWKHAAIDGELILCDTPEERAAERARFKRLVKAHTASSAARARD